MNFTKLSVFAGACNQFYTANDIFNNYLITISI